MDKLSFGGITTLDVGLMPDASSKDVLNFRPKSGSFEPVSLPDIKGELPKEVTKVYYHKSADMYILTTYLRKGSIAVDRNLDHLNPVAIFPHENNVNDIQFIGNMVCFIHSDKITYAIYENGTYKYLGERPKLPDIEWNATPLTKKNIFHIDSYDVDLNEKSVPYFLKGFSQLNKELAFCGSLLFRYAFRLSDGTYAFHSPVMLAEYSNKVFALKQQGKNVYFDFQKPYTWTQFDTEISTYTLGFKYDFILKDAKYSLEKWSSVIVSIDLFVCPLSWFELKKNNKGREEFKVLDKKDFSSLIPKQHLFYKYMEFDLEGNPKLLVDDVSLDNLSVQETIDDDAFSNNTFGANSSYVYNSRLHIGNIEEKFFIGYGENGFLSPRPIDPVSQNIKKRAIVFTKISTEIGESIVKREVFLGERINPFISYPDTRAKELTIYLLDDNMYKTFPLKKHDFLNLSYYLKDREYIQTSEYTEKIPYSFIDYGTFIPGQPNIEEKNSVNRRGNVVKVSGINNPLSFPAAQTYPMSDNVVAMRSNAVALSQGQFGQFPLLVFCEDGIQAMEVGSGEVVYSRTSSVSRDVCTNPNSVCSIDRGVVFISKKGVMISYGSECKLISSDMDGDDAEFSSIEGKIANLFQCCLPVVAFREFLDGARIGYFYAEQEIILGNPSYNYSYVYSLEAGIWYRISVNAKEFLNSYPECEVLLSTNFLCEIVYDLGFRNQGMIITRPVQFGSTNYKQIWQTALRGFISSERAGFYILASNDGKNFKVMTGKEIQNKDEARDMVVQYTKQFSSKYFIFVVAGKFDKKTKLDYIEYAVTESFKNRLR